MNAEVKERAESILSNPNAKINRHSLIRDLLADIERLEKVSASIVNGDVVAELTRLNVQIAELEQKLANLTDSERKLSCWIDKARKLAVNCGMPTDEERTTRYLEYVEARIVTLGQENKTLEVRLCRQVLKNAQAAVDARRQVARECVEIVNSQHVDEYGNGQCCEIVEAIKQKFGLEEE
jgi:hypothetical protein